MIVAIEDNKAIFNTAILFLVFNRPSNTAIVFEQIRKIAPSRLYVAADGPRHGKEGEAELTTNVRKIATAVDWSCKVTTLFREENMGCRAAVGDAITWFFSMEQEGIILEDDCLPSESFFWFCQAMLSKYRTEEKIGSIRGTHLSMHDGASSYYFSRHALPWGWASWARAWNKSDRQMTSWPQATPIRHLKSLNVGGWLFSLHFAGILKKVARREIDSWSNPWMYNCWCYELLTVCPPRNLIRNIGFSDEATNTITDHPVLSNLKANELEWPVQGTPSLTPNDSADAFILKCWFGIGVASFLKSLAVKIFGLQAMKSLKKSVLYCEKLVFRRINSRDNAR